MSGHETLAVTISTHVEDMTILCVISHKQHLFLLDQPRNLFIIVR